MSSVITLTHFTYYFGVSSIDFKQVDTRWVHNVVETNFIPILAITLQTIESKTAGSIKEITEFGSFLFKRSVSGTRFVVYHCLLYDQLNTSWKVCNIVLFFCSLFFFIWTLFFWRFSIFRGYGKGNLVWKWLMESEYSAVVRGWRSFCKFWDFAF